MSRDIVVLGSTGSIGTQALEIVSANPDRFSIVALTSGGSNVDVLAAQAAEFTPQLVGVADDAAVPALRERLASLRVESEIVAGPSANEIAAGVACDVVLNGITGSVGLAATLRALQCGSTLALANKESLVVGGALVTGLAKTGQIVPVDSEHSALAQCLRSGSHEEVRRLVLTASGGPFRGMAAEELAMVTVADALAHPTWSMGPVVTVNSATMVNKGLELIEAHLLFGIEYDRIDVVVHPQSVVHSMVEFVDGSTIAQASPPDMRLPIAMGLAWPERVAGAAPACDWTTSTQWEFFPLDGEAFPAVGLAGAAGRLSGTAPAVFNAANEEAVAAFLAGNLAFVNIVPTVAAVLDVHCNAPAGTPAAHVADGELTVEAVLAAESWARRAAREVLAK